MLTNPLPLPSHQSAEVIHNPSPSLHISGQGGVTYGENVTLFALSDNRNGMGADGFEERIEADRPDIIDDSDEDEDMSYGGAPLTMTLSHAEQLNAEMDEIDAEVMGVENLLGLYTHYATTGGQHTQYPATQAQNTQVAAPGQPQMTHSDAFLHGTTIYSNLPAAMSEVSQQLQHLQNEQEHGESMDLAEDHQVGQFVDNIADQQNLGLSNFLYHWSLEAARVHREEMNPRTRGPCLAAIDEQGLDQFSRMRRKLPPVHRDDLQGARCDIQRINWEELGVSRMQARQMRRKTYKNYINQRSSGDPYDLRMNVDSLDNDQDFFRFRRMDFNHRINLSHFQLRNLMSCAYRDHVFYAGREKILQWNPQSSHPPGPAVAMDLTDPVVQNPQWQGYGGIQISTMTVAHDILVAGGFSGEYGLVNLRASKDTKHTEGIVSQDPYGITNNVQVHLSRHSSFPRATFASNDKILRVLDVSTNKFIAEHNFENPVNCTAISPDQCLRVVVGDTRQVMICNAETGEVLQSLEGHRDYGFACDWADDGWTVATGNQDKQIKIWDARMWKSRNGLAQPVATIAAEMAGVRKLKFSPVGSGKRVLLAAEPADIISVIDGESFDRKQTLSFFGEIGGVDFTNGGQDVIVANCDSVRGGLMEYERCNLAGEGLHGLEDFDEPESRQAPFKREKGYDWIAADQDIIKHPRSRGTQEQRRRIATSAIPMGYF